MHALILNTERARGRETNDEDNIKPASAWLVCVCVSSLEFACNIKYVYFIIHIVHAHNTYAGTEEIVQTAIQFPFARASGMRIYTSLCFACANTIIFPGIMVDARTLYVWFSSAQNIDHI